MPEHVETTKEIRGAQEGVLRSFVSLGAGLTDATVGSAFGAVEDVRANVVGRARGLIDWIESVQQSNVALARKLTDRVDVLSRAFVASGEQALKTLVLTGRETSHGALDTASRSAAAFISRPERAPQA